MSKYLHLQIPQVCHENWDKMDMATQGKFCNSCQKNVIDFTLMSDNDLVNFFKKNRSNVCGRLNAEQLDKPILIPPKKIPWVKYFFQVAIPAFLLSSKVTAQSDIVKGKIACYQAPEIKTGEIKFSDTVTSETSKIINGAITDDKGQPVPYASVMVKGTHIGTAADSAGKFTIRLPYSYATLRISSVGCEPVEINCNSMPDGHIVLVSMAVRDLIGMVGYIVPKKKKKTFSIPFLSNRNANMVNSFTIFPNPAPANSTLNISWKESVMADQSVEIYNTTGNLFQQQPLRLNKKTRLQSIELKQIPAGTYIIKITDSKTHKSSSQQFIVL